MNYAITPTPNELPLMAAPEQPLRETLRSMASAVVHAARSLPEFTASSIETFSLADGIAYAEEKKEPTVIPAEDPEAVKKRDGVQPETVTPRGQPQAAPRDSGPPTTSGRKTPSGPASEDGEQKKKDRK